MTISPLKRLLLLAFFSAFGITACAAEESATVRAYEVTAVTITTVAARMR